jgi:hypothetical protein
VWEEIVFRQDLGLLCGGAASGGDPLVSNGKADVQNQHDMSKASKETEGSVRIGRFRFSSGVASIHEHRSSGLRLMVEQRPGRDEFGRLLLSQLSIRSGRQARLGPFDPLHGGEPDERQDCDPNQAGDPA